jgi:hypothetical protein
VAATIILFVKIYFRKSDTEWISLHFPQALAIHSQRLRLCYFNMLFSIPLCQAAVILHSMSMFLVLSSSHPPHDPLRRDNHCTDGELTIVTLKIGLFKGRPLFGKVCIAFGARAGGCPMRPGYKSPSSASTLTCSTADLKFPRSSKFRIAARLSSLSKSWNSM